MAFRVNDSRKQLVQISPQKDVDLKVMVCIGIPIPPQKHHPLLSCRPSPPPLPLNLQTLQAPCALRLVETFWPVETFVSECLNFS